jgi:hypothetical protein
MLSAHRLFQVSRGNLLNYTYLGVPAGYTGSVQIAEDSLPEGLERMYLLLVSAVYQQARKILLLFFGT